MWEVLAFFRVIAVFAAFFVLLPVWARGARANGGPAGRAVTFVRFCVFVEVAIVLLGVVGLALPGALFVVCFFWLGADFVQREPELFAGADRRREWIASRLSRIRAAGYELLAQVRSTTGCVSGLWLLPATALVTKAVFPVLNSRLTDIDDYSRSLSLAVLSSGHQWIPDFSVPLLLPLQYLASVSAPRALALAEPIFAAVLIAAIGLAVHQMRGCRVAAAVAMSAGVLLMLSPLMAGTDKMARAELSVAFVILAISVQSASRLDALLSLALGVAVGFTPGHFAASLQTLLPYGSCVLLGLGIGDLRVQLSAGSRRLAIIALVVCIVGAAPYFLSAPAPDGPVQYEEAARIARRLADEQPRNSWALVSTTQELPFVYGRGWHVELASFFEDVNLNHVARPSYRFPFPVRDVYFLVERKPLVPHTSARLQTPMQVRLTPSSSAAYGTPLERASLEFKLAELLSVYRQHHGDMETVYRSATVDVLRAPGSLRDERWALSE